MNIIGVDAFDTIYAISFYAIFVNVKIWLVKDSLKIKIFIRCFVSTNKNIFLLNSVLEIFKDVLLFIYGDDGELDITNNVDATNNIKL